MIVLRTGLLLAAMTALLVAVGGLLGGPAGMAVSFPLALAANACATWNAGRLVLRRYRAVEVDEWTAPALAGLVQGLAARAGLPAPRVYLIDEAQPNAFATGCGPSGASVAATTGLLARLTREELAGVMAHELAHVRHRDTLFMTLTATLAGALAGSLVSLACSLLGALAALLVMLAAPLGVTVAQMAISRAREYEADRLGALICDDPLWLAQALRRVTGGLAHAPEPSERLPASQPMFILPPSERRPMDSPFSTHPAPENRIAALLAIARSAGGPSHPAAGGLLAPRLGAGPPSHPSRARSPW